MQIKIRPFQLSDYAQLKQLLEVSMSEACFTESMEAVGRQLLWDSSLVLIAELESSREMIGIIIGTIDNNEGYYYRVAVPPQHRRQGIGRSLMSAMQERFMRRKVRRILIPLDQHNEPAMPFFESLGFGRQHFTRGCQRLSIVAGS
jgi:ribosomal protein S18 acetylase RimI-like enzyme